MTINTYIMKEAIENLPAESLLEVVNTYREEVAMQEPIHYADYYEENCCNAPAPTFEEAVDIATEYLDENMTAITVCDWMEVLAYVGYEPADLF